MPILKCETRSNTIRRSTKLSPALPQVRAVLVVVADIFREEPFQVTLVEHDPHEPADRPELSTQRSATPFCQRLRNEVLFGLLPIARMAAITSSLNFLSRSRITYL
jgi:hypothetical protein